LNSTIFELRENKKNTCSSNSRGLKKPTVKD